MTELHSLLEKCRRDPVLNERVSYKRNYKISFIIKLSEKLFKGVCGLKP